MKFSNRSLAGLLLVAMLAAGCTQQAGTRSARLIGTYDVVLVGENTDKFLAAKSITQDGTFSTVGIPARYTFVTSADTNELRLLENFTPGVLTRSFAAAPNPLETLSIPVLDRPTMLAVDEGRNSEGTRVTGAYVYAARPGGAEISVVRVTDRRQVAGRPMPTPGPVTAIGTFMEVDAMAPFNETPIPTATQLYVSTWDGEFSAVYRATLPTAADAEFDHLDYERLVLIGQMPITAMLVMPPLANRTLDGAPFCATTVCIALSTRVNSGVGGEAFVIDPATGQRATLDFSGPLRKLVNSSTGGRIYGVLDEQACGGPACGGVVAVDVVAAVTVPPSGPVFPAARDATGAPMAPLRTGDGLITGLAIGSFHRNVNGMQNSGTILQPRLTPETDGGATEGVLQEYNELGAFASSSGLITFFSGLAGSIIDYDARRATVVSANVRLPGRLSDGGLSFFTEDGGAFGTGASLPIEATNPGDDTFRVVAVGPAEAPRWTIDISDGYLRSQSLAFVYQGQIPGLVALATSAADGVRLTTGGPESRAAVGDIVRFESGSDTAGYAECGRSTIATIGAGFIEVADVPAACADRVRFSVRADGAQRLVAVAELEGYLGRFAPGETLTYNRAYVIIPADVVAPRTALTVTVPTVVDELEGAITSFEINGFIVPYQMSLDTIGLQQTGSGNGCDNTVTRQVVMGNLVMDRVPTYANTDQPEFQWLVMGVVPSGNSMVEIRLKNAHFGPLTGVNSDAICRR